MHGAGVHDVVDLELLLQVGRPRVDEAANDAEDLALLNHFNLFAPPAILFYGTDKQERSNYRLVGFMDADDFQGHVRNALGR